ncbi:calcium-binding protein [Actinoplanes sp. G11-F43]|uniref:calcium-binding protein n=1 Tax=Actinoplanes sp. G11-F43 TaxID=3424130 RepID=UPI003D34A946
MVVSRWLTGAALTLFTTVSAGVLAGPAQAASVGVAKVVTHPAVTYVEYKAASGKKNRVVVSGTGKSITIDDRYTIKPGRGCKTVKKDKTKVRCTTSRAVINVRVWTYDKADSVRTDSSLPLVVEGGSGNDVLYGGSGSDSLLGGSGTDRIYGRGGRDLITGGSSADYLYGGDHTDSIYGSSGNDRIRGGAGSDWLYGEAGADYIWGEDGDDWVDGDRDNDVLSGGAGKDRVTGDDGDDRVYGGADDDTLYAMATSGEGVGADYYSGGSGRDLVTYSKYIHSGVIVDADGAVGDDGAEGERDTVATDVESLMGTMLNDVLLGGPGDNTLTGWGGDDRLIGGGGADTLLGGSGDDYLDSSDTDSRGSTVDGEYGDDECVPGVGDQIQNCENIRP